jgi:CubicO group peptidase (beta-lactamase class C family)
MPIKPDYWPTNGWRTSTPEEQGIDSEQLAELIDYLQEQNGFDIHSLLIIRNGYIVADAYFYPFAPDMLHDLASATKSFMSTLIGIAINQGYIESVEQPVLDFFPERSVANLDANKEAMTLEDLLTMRSGLSCQGESTTQEMMASPDWTQFALDQPMTREPGTSYDYCGLNSHLLSAIVQETTGMSALTFGVQYLFGPVGVSDVRWPSDPQGNSWGWGEMNLGPHDMAKLGYLFLNDGQWDGQQLVSAEWVEAATSGSSYGYQWWLKPSGIYYATGVGGQEIWVLPDQKMVVVMTGSSGGGGTGAWGDLLMKSRILPLAESTTSLPPNPNGMAALASRIRQAAASPQPEPVPPLPEIAHQVAGKTIVLDPNQVGLQTVSLDFPEQAEAAVSLSFSDGSQVEWPVGLDNLYRFTPFEYGLTMGLKGWWESDNVFVVQRDVIGGYERESLTTTFEEDQIAVEIQNLTAGGGGSVTLIGQLEE